VGAGARESLFWTSGTVGDCLMAFLGALLIGSAS